MGPEERQEEKGRCEGRSHMRMRYIRFAVTAEPVMSFPRFDCLQLQRSSPVGRGIKSSMPGKARHSHQNQSSQLLAHSPIPMRTAQVQTRTVACICWCQAVLAVAVCYSSYPVDHHLVPHNTPQELHLRRTLSLRMLAVWPQQASGLGFESAVRIQFPALYAALLRLPHQA